MNKNIPIILGSIVVVLVVGGFLIFQNSQKGADQPNPSMTTGTTPMVAPSGSSSDSMQMDAATKELTVNGSNYKFEPASLTVSKGDKVKITFSNSGGMHDLRIDDFSVGTNVIKSGESETIEFTADKAGSFEYYCSVGNHRAMGMKGTLTVN